MRRLVALLVCLAAFPAWALVSIINDAPQHGGGGGGIALVNSCKNGGAAAASCTVDLTGANFLVIASTSTDGANTDSLGTTYANLVSGGCSSAPDCFQYAYVSTVSGNVTFTASNCSFCMIVGAGYSGTIGSTVDQTTGQGNATGGSNTCQNTNAITPGHDNEVVIYTWSLYPVGTGGSVGVDSSFTLRQSDVLVAATHYGIGFADIIQTTAGAVHPTYTLTGQTVSSSECVIGSFQ